MHKDLLGHFLNAPDSHIDSYLKEKILGLVALEDSVEATKGMMKVLNEGVRHGRVSDLTVKAIEVVLQILCLENDLNFDEENKSAQVKIEEKERTDMM